MHMKHLKHMFVTSEEGREREVQPEKPAPGLATPDLVVSRAEVERRSDAGVDSGHDLLVGNGGVGSTLTRRGTGHGAQAGIGHSATWWSGRGWGWSMARRQTWNGST